MDIAAGEATALAQSHFQGHRSGWRGEAACQTEELHCGDEQIDDLDIAAGAETALALKQYVVVHLHAIVIYML